MNRSFAILFLCLFAVLNTLSATPFTDGTTAYEAGDYETATKQFTASIKEAETAAARHNLALSYFQLGQPAEAAWQIERALRIDPLNTEYHYKLGALRQQLGLFEAEPEWYIIGAQLLTVKTWLITACISFWLLLASWLLPRIGGIPSNLGIQAIRILTLIALMITLPAIWLHEHLDQSGIVICEAPTDLHAAPASASPASGVARPGERARVIDQHNEFYKVESEGNASGWIEKTNFRSLVLAPPAGK